MTPEEILDRVIGICEDCDHPRCVGRKQSALADIERIRLEDRLHDAKQVEFTLKDIVQPESNVRKATRAYTALSLQEKRIKELQSKLEER